MLTVADALAAAAAASKNPQTIARCRKYAAMQGYGDDGDFCEFVTRCITHEAEFVDFSKGAWQSDAARLNGLSAVAAVLETDCARTRLDCTSSCNKYVDVKRKLVQLQQRFRQEKKDKDKVKDKDQVEHPSKDSSSSSSSSSKSSRGGEEEVENGEQEEDDDCDDDLSLQDLESAVGGGEVTTNSAIEVDFYHQRDYLRVIFQQSRRIRELELRLAAAAAARNP